MTRKFLLLLFFWHFVSFANNDCLNAVVLTPGLTCSTTTGSFNGATLSGTAPSCAASSLQDVWYKFIATEATISIGLNAVSGLNHGLEIFMSGCEGTLVACINENGSGQTENYFNNNFIVGQEYYVRVFNVSGTLQAYNFQICLTKYSTPANDLCANAQQLTPGTTCSLVSGTFSGSLKDGGVPACATAASQDVWYKFTATDVTMSVGLTAVANLNSGFELYQGGCNGTLITCVNEDGLGYGENYFNNNFIVGQEYYVRVFNASGTLQVRNFQICVTKYPTPANDLCANAQQLTPGTTCSLVSGSFSGSLKDGGVPACATAASQDVWYKFIATEATINIGLNAVSGLNHGLEIFMSGCEGTLVACINENGSGQTENYFNNNFIVGQEYYIRVFNVSGTLQAYNFQICLTKYSTPANDLCANAQQLTPGTTCSLVSGTFSGSLKDGGVPACATAASQDVWYKFTATDVTMSIGLTAVANLNSGFELYQGGCNGTLITCINEDGSGYGENYFNNNFIVGQEYYVRVFNASSTLQVRNFQICVTKYPTPANDLCANAQQLTPGTTCSLVNGSFSGSLKDGGVPACATAASQDVWYKFTATDVTMSVGLTAVANLNSGFELYQGGCNGTLITCVNEDGSGYGENYFNNNFIVGQEYYVRVFNASSTLQVRNFQICVTKYPTPANDLCANAQQLTPGTTCSLVNGSFSGSLKDGGVPACATAASQDVWYKFTATDVTMSVDFTAVAYLDFGFELYQGGCNGTLITCVNEDGSGYGENYFNNNFIVGQEYYVRVFNASSTLQVRNFQICVTKYPTPANDLCANAQQLTPGTTCSLVNGSFSGSLKDGGVPACATAASQDVWYKFTATDVTMSVGLTAVAYLNSGFELYQGGCNGTLITCVNEYGSGYGEGYFNNNFIVGQEYYVRVFNPISTLQVRDFQICLTKYPTPANDLCANAQQLTPGTTCSLVSGSFSGSLKDGGVPACATAASQDVWYKFTATDVTMSVDFTAVAYLDFGFELYQGGCNGTLITCVNESGSGYAEDYFNNNFIVGQEYYVRVFNASSTLQVRNFQICVTKYPTPANDLCANAQQLTPGTTCSLVSGTFSGSLKDGGVPACATAALQDVWYKFTATDATMSIGLPAVSYLNSGFELYQGGCNGTLIACINNNGSGLSENYSNNSFIVGQEYYIRVFNVSSVLQTRSFSICLQGPPPAACTPSVSIAATATTICQAESITFTATPTNGGTSPSYQWKIGSANVGTNSPTYTASSLTNGSVVTCIMVSSAACASPASVTSNAINISVTNQIQPTFAQIAAKCKGESFTLPSISDNNIQGTWSPAVNNNATTTYTFTPNPGQCALNTTMTVVVNVVDAAVTTQGSTITASQAGATYQWINCADGQPINNASGISYTATANGSYAVIVTHNGCSATSECVVISNLDNKDFIQKRWIAYPNPAEEKLFIETDDAADVTITEISGKIIRHLPLQPGINTIDITSLSSGMYFIKSGTSNLKFIKK